MAEDMSLSVQCSECKDPLPDEWASQSFQKIFVQNVDHQRRQSVSVSMTISVLKLKRV